jgi:hypothetical protein
MVTDEDDEPSYMQPYDPKARRGDEAWQLRGETLARLAAAKHEKGDPE